MDVSHLLDSLNEPQRQAVTAPPGPLRVLAGAGSGKTRVLVQRIAWLMAVENASPWSILAVTFTNKAANEMRARVEKLVTYPPQGLWIGTFHGLAHRLLRYHHQEAKLPKGFQILDAEDQKRTLRQVLKSLNLDERKWPPPQVSHFINARKDEGQRPQHVVHHNDPVLLQYIRIYQTYQGVCERSGVVDFGELLLRAFELWRDNPPLLEHYRQRFRHVLVDEFQDTNFIQYRWVQLLTGGQGDIFIVGDDDQSIYGWRGARVENILRFEEDFPGVETIRLEQNYRSTGTILQAANALIAHNQGRLGKNLWTEDEAGLPIEVYTAYNERDEARFVAERILQWVEKGQRCSDVALLYRSNAQSRALEETLVGMKIPYRVYGGVRFFERAEIKDALAYLRLAASRDDDPSFERVINNPPRSVGERTLDAIRTTARECDISLWRAATRLVRDNQPSPRAARAVQGFMVLIDQLDRETEELPLSRLVDLVIRRSGLWEALEASRDPKAPERLENLDELVSASKSFEPDPDDTAEGLTPLTAFLASASLEAGEGQGQDGQDCVQLMTLHSAKGLEFPLVFLVGLEEGQFPSQRSVAEEAKLEEERRLAYVGITRAKAQLVMSYAERRRIHGNDLYCRPSRFLAELPGELLQDVRSGAKLFSKKPDRTAVADEGGGLRPGQRVRHPKFGEGVVRALEGRGSGARAQVSFKTVGSKWLVLAYAKLEAL
ncbi:MAG: DNA helicase II [Candidatus Competibacterales bacterium]